MTNEIIIRGDLEFDYNELAESARQFHQAEADAAASRALWAEIANNYKAWGATLPATPAVLCDGSQFSAMITDGAGREWRLWITTDSDEVCASLDTTDAVNGAEMSFTMPLAEFPPGPSDLAYSVVFAAICAAVEGGKL